MRHSRLIGAAVLGCALMLGCRAAVTPTPAPEPPEAALTLQGTWLWEESYVDDEDGRTYDEVQVLTFTGRPAGR